MTLIHKIVLQWHHTMFHPDPPDQERERVLRLWGPFLPSYPIHSTLSEVPVPGALSGEAWEHSDSVIQVFTGTGWHYRKVKLHPQRQSLGLVPLTTAARGRLFSTSNSSEVQRWNESLPFILQYQDIRWALTSQAKPKPFSTAHFQLAKLNFSGQSSTLQEALMTRAHCSKLGYCFVLVMLFYIGNRWKDETSPSLPLQQVGGGNQKGKSGKSHGLR